MSRALSGLGHEISDPTEATAVDARSLLTTRRSALGLGAATMASIFVDRAASPCPAQAAPGVNELVNVKDYGAKGDGASDDTEAFELALATAATSTLLIPQGVFRITKTLSIPPATSIIGLGQSSVIQAIGCHALSFAISTSICPTKISNFVLRGDGTYAHDAIRSEGTANEGDEVNSVIVEQMMFQSWRHGIYGRTIWRWNILWNLFYQVWQPIEVVGQSVVVRIENNLMLREGAKGSGTSTGIYIAGAGDYGPSESVFGAPQDVQAHGNTIQQYEVGIYSYECLLARYRDNDIDSCSLYGIAYAWSSGGMVVDGNWIGGTTGFKYGIYALPLAAEQANSHATIANNHITGEEGEPNDESIGIYVSTNHENILITANSISHMALNDIRLQNCARARILDNSCNSLRSGNSIYIIGTQDHTYIDRNYVAREMFVDPNPRTNAVVTIGDTYGAQSTRIRGTVVMKAGMVKASVTYSEMNGAPPNFNGGAPSYLPAHLRIDPPEANLGAIWGTASNEGVTVHCVRAPMIDTVIYWEATTSGRLS
jgi:Pectate lyase superfamily protein